MNVKKILAVLLGTTAVFSLVACGSNDTPGPSPDGNGGDVTNPDGGNDVLNTKLELKYTRVEVPLGTNLETLLRDSILVATYDDGTSALSAVRFTHTIQTDDGSLTQAGTYKVTISLTEGSNKIEKELSIVVLAEDAVQLPGVTDIQFKPDGISADYLFDFDTDAKQLELQEMFGEGVDLNTLVQYKYDIVDASTGEIIFTQYKDIGNYRVSLPTGTSFREPVVEYLKGKNTLSVTISGNVQIVKRAGVTEPILNSDVTSPENNFTFEMLAENADVTLPTPVNGKVSNLATTWLATFTYGTATLELTNAFNVSNDILASSINYVYRIYDTDKTDAQLIIEVVKPFATNGNAQLKNTEVLYAVEEYMDNNGINSLNFDITMQIMKSENCTLTQNITNGEETTFGTIAHVLPEVLGTPFLYTSFAGTQISKAELEAGQISAWDDANNDSTSLLAFQDAEDHTKFSLFGTQNSSTTWYALQFLAKFGVVGTAGRYEATMIFESDKAGWITIQSIPYYIEEGTTTITLKLDFAANGWLNFQICFGQNTMADVDSTIGDFSIDLTLVGLTKI